MTIRERMLAVALSEYGESRPERILDYLRPLRNNPESTRVISWCSAFVDHCRATVGPHPRPLITLAARSWLNFGEPRPLFGARRGDVVVLWRVRPDSWKGHVGLYIRHNGIHVWLLGGNQRGKVCIRRYKRERVLGVRRL